MAIECEAKFQVDSLDAIRARLEEAGCTGGERVLERNWVLDRPGDRLLREGTLLRVRNCGGEGGVLTVKGKCRTTEFKTREEVESPVESTDNVLRQMAMLGFVVKCIYEKYRETWRWRDCTLMLDECPELGYFLEIEGTPDDIRRTAADLGLDCDDHLKKSYLDLWCKYLRKRGENYRHMVFEAGCGAKVKLRSDPKAS